MTTPDINFYAIIDETAVPTKEVVYYTNVNEAIVFGNFTLEECSLAQCITRPASTSVATQTTNDLLPNYPVPPPLYFRQPIPCTRCGHLSHTVDKCVAKWNINGERIHPTTPKKNKFEVYPPTSPSHTHYYNTHLIKNGWCEQDNTDYNDFIFTSDDVYQWIDEQQDLFVPQLPPVAPEPAKVVYVPVVVRNKPYYAPVVIPSPDQEIDYILRYNYAMTDYMLGRQAAYVY
jgi:hypothetical protein